MSILALKKEVLLTLFLPAVIVGKIVRWNFSGSLVENSLGHAYLNDILYGTPGFSIWNFSSSLSVSDNVIFLYKFLTVFGLNTYNDFEALISVVFNLLLFFMLIRLKNIIDPPLLIFSLVSVVLLNMFAFTLAKEPIQMLLFTSYWHILQNSASVKKRGVLIIAVAILYILLLRAYYILMIIFFLSLQSQTSIGRDSGPGHWFAALAATACIFFCILKISALLAPDVYSTLQYLRSAKRIDAHLWNTSIKPLFTAGGVTDILLTLEFFSVLFRLLIPLELLVITTRVNWLLKIMFIMYQLLVTTKVCVNIKEFRRLSKEKKIALNLFLAFLFMSSVFEPDFGSFVRHESICFPVLLLVFDKSENNI